MNSVLPSASVAPPSVRKRPRGAVAPASHPEERERIEALHALDILDTAAEARFDRLTALAADFFEVPIALVSFVDENRQWFKSACGLSVSETPREVSFCGHAILESSILVVENALRDPRFSDNPLVVGAPNLRFYAGVVLRTASNLPLGTLCLADTVPRVFDRKSRSRLIALAQIVEQEIEHHTDLKRLRVLTEAKQR